MSNVLEKNVETINIFKLEMLEKNSLKVHVNCSEGP